MIRRIYNRRFSRLMSVFPYYSLTIGTAVTSDEEAEYLDQFEPVKTYEKFLSAIQKASNIKMTAIYEIQLDTDCDTFYLFKVSGTNAKFIVKYKPENTELLELTKKIFRITDSKLSTVLLSTKENKYIVGIPTEVLSVIYSYYNIKSQNEIVFLKFKHKSKNGKIRDIIAPHTEIKKNLRKLNLFLQNVYDNRNDIQIAYKRGKCIKDGALRHAQHNYIFNIDLKDFYPSCKRELVEIYVDFLFRNSYNREFLKEEFMNIILIDDGLFIGSPISGTLANAVLSKSIVYLNNICKKHDITLTVYADDISFSSDRYLSEKTVLAMFDEAFIKHGLDQYFKINQKKSLGYSGSRRKVTGVSINDANQVTVGRKYYRNLRVLLDKLSFGDGSININQLKGKIAYALMIDTSGKILNYLKKYKNTVQQYSLYSGQL